MIDLKNGELLDLLKQTAFANNIEVQCISYALKFETRRILDILTTTMTQAGIDELPEQILDVLAVELNAPYYEQDMEIDVKRGIIKNTLAWHMKSGTASAVSEMIGTIFGEGSVVEWFNFTDGDRIPGTFDIVTNAQMTEDIVQKFIEIIERVKNERSHLRRVMIERDIEVTPRAAVSAVSFPRVIISNNSTHDDLSLKGEGRPAAGTLTYPRIKITSNKEEKNSSIHVKESGGSGFVQSPHLTITNHPKAEMEAGTAPASFAGAVSYPRTIIKQGGIGNGTI